jgi:hypothetical protein
MVEVSLLLPMSQATALVTAAQGWGLTAGEVLRRLIRDFTERRHCC